MAHIPDVNGIDWGDAVVSKVLGVVGSPAEFWCVALVCIHHTIECFHGVCRSSGLCIRVAAAAHILEAAAVSLSRLQQQDSRPGGMHDDNASGGVWLYRHA